MNHFLLELLARHAGPGLAGRRVGRVRWLPPLLAVELAGDGGRLWGVVVLAAPGPFFYVDASDPTAGAGAEVFRRVEGLAVAHVEALERDRVVRIALSAPREEFVLSVSLYGSAAKVRVEGRDTVVESLDARENGGPLPPRRTGEGPTLVAATAADFARLPAPGDVPERAMHGLTREILDCFPSPEGGLDVPGLLRFRDGLVRGSEPFLLATRRSAGSVSPLPPVLPGGIEDMTAVFGPYTSVEEACRDVGRAIARSLHETLVERCAAPLVKHLAARKRLLSALEGERREADSATDVRREANILASYRSRVPYGAREATLPDPYGPGEVTVRLDPSLPVKTQIDKRFRLAAKLERKRTAIVKRIGAVEKEIALVEEELALARAAADLGSAATAIDRARKRSGLVAPSGRSGKARPAPRELRRFDLDPQWFVLVGRSDRENDEITFRIADPEDIWFHAQHVAGSHVVLRSRGPRGNPPAAVLEAAAEIAAHYSKARRASVVPVIYTRRKYVRKFKGAKPGQVTCEREKTILARPRLPGSSGE